MYEYKKHYIDAADAQGWSERCEPACAECQISMLNILYYGEFRNHTCDRCGLLTGHKLMLAPNKGEYFVATVCRPCAGDLQPMANSFYTAVRLDKKTRSWWI